MSAKLKKLLRKTERGQAIILIAFAIVGMIGMVGLMVDGGVLLIEYGRLKRSIDAASVASALQFRRGFTNADLTTAAQEFLQLNQSDVFNVLIETCDPVTPQNWCPPLNQPQ
ncbi:MAG: pilus assembly protein TadG-related protein [Anaerolineales bacterium]